MGSPAPSHLLRASGRRACATGAPERPARSPACQAAACWPLHPARAAAPGRLHAPPAPLPAAQVTQASGCMTAPAHSAQRACCGKQCACRPEHIPLPTRRRGHSHAAALSATHRNQVALHEDRAHVQHALCCFANCTASRGQRQGGQCFGADVHHPACGLHLYSSAVGGVRAGGGWSHQPHTPFSVYSQPAACASRLVSMCSRGNDTAERPAHAGGRLQMRKQAGGHGQQTASRCCCHASPPQAGVPTCTTRPTTTCPTAAA